jgi:hypothetical protein
MSLSSESSYASLDNEDEYDLEKQNFKAKKLYKINPE